MQQKLLVSFSLVFFWWGQLSAQTPLDIQIVIAEPYPTELEYYLQNAQNLFINVTNTSGIEQKVYYHVRLIGVNNGFDAQTKVTHKPFEPVSVPTYGSLFYTGPDIERDFAFTYPEDVDLISASPEQLDYIAFNRSLPEGTYQLCITARDFLTDVALNFECSDEFTISYGDIPYIYMPFMEEVVPASGNAHVTIGWEPPFTLAPPPGTFSYHLKMIDITELSFGDIELAMNNPGILPVLDARDIQTSIYNYDFPPEIELEVGHQYALRVQASDLTGTFPLSNNGYSEVSTFWYGYNAIDAQSEGTTTTPSQQQNDCYVNCYYEDDISNTACTENALTGFTEVAIGNFVMKNLEFTTSNPEGAYGRGTIDIPFLNNVSVDVEFSNIAINQEGRVFRGTVNAIVDRVYDPTNMSPNLAAEMNNFIHNGRMVSALATGQGSIGLPLGLVQNIAGYNFMLGFTSIAFMPDRAECQVMQNLHIPQFGDAGWLSMAMSDVCLIPAGFGGEYTLHPVNDWLIPYEGDMTFLFKGSTSSDHETIKDEATYFEVDCNGIKSFAIKGEVHFPQSTLVKEDEDGEIVNEKVIGSFAVEIDRTVAVNENIYAAYGQAGLPEDAGFHFLVNANLDPFQIKGIPGWGYQALNAWIDMSDFENPPSIRWPASYDDPNIQVGGNGKSTMMPTWKGIYIQDLELKTPKEFLGGNRRESASINHMIIDPLVSMTIAVEDLIGRDEGDVDGWSLSMDSLFLTIVQNRLESGGFSGVLGLPITKEGTYLRYTALIEDSNTSNTSLDSPSYIFSIQPKDNLEFPFLMAKATLSENTHVLGKFTPGNAAQTYFEAYFEGGLGINSELFSTTEGDNIPLTIPIADFVFSYHSQNGFSDSHFGFCEELQSINNEPINYEYDASYGNQFSEEGFGGFPINIEEAGLNAASANEVSMFIRPLVSIAGDEGGIAGSVRINIRSEFATVNGKKRLQLKGMDVSAMSIYSEVYGLTIEGSIEFYNNVGSDNVGTKGAKGNLEVMLPIGVGASLAAEFGTSVSNATAAYGTAQNYGYWYLDGMVYFGPMGIPLATGIGMYGIGGGVSVNMTRGNSGPSTQGEVNSMLANVNSQNVASSKNNPVIGTGSLPRPQFGSYALKMATTLGTHPTAALLNMDVSIYGEFSKNSGINLIEVAGDAFLFTPLSMRSKANFWASAAFRWEKMDDETSNYDGLIDVFVNVAPVLYGDQSNQNRMVKAAFHAESGGNKEWYFYAGTADERGQLTLDLLLAPPTEFQAYLMAGHGIPTTLPIPERVAFLMDNASTGEGDNELTDYTAVNKNGDKRSSFETTLQQTGTGIAFGMEGSLSTGVDAWLIYAKLTGTLGFDINITHMEGSSCYISGQGTIPPGINGWYAMGQVYAALEGEVGIEFRFAGKDYNIELFYMAAAMMLSGGGPNPIWVEGRAGVTYRLLKGAVKGTKRFDVRIGDKCVPTSSDPFSGLEIIYETLPADGELQVSVFADPSVNFVLPINEEFTLPVMKDNGTTKDMTVLLEVDKLSLKQVGGSTVPEKSETLDESGQNIILELDQILSEKTEYEGTVKVIGYEVKSSGNVRLKDENSADWFEERKWTFKTGETPYPIPDEEIVKTIPIRRQQYYMQGDNLIKAGLIEFNSNMKDVDPDKGYFPEDNDTWNYSYYLRWHSLEGHAPIIQELDQIESYMIVDQILSGIPDLENSTIYSCQLIRKKTKKGIIVGANINKTLSFGFTDLNSDVSSQTDIVIDIPPLPGELELDGEDIIYQFYFKTSSFDFMRDKLNSLTTNVLMTNANALQTSYNSAELELEGPEDFDVFEIKGEMSGGTVITSPRVKIGVDEAEAGATSAMKTMFTDVREAYNAFNIDTRDIHERYHNVTYYSTISYIGKNFPVGTTLSLKENKFTWSDLDLSVSSMYIPLQDRITGYKAKLSDTDIENAWTNSQTQSEAGAILSGSSTRANGFDINEHANRQAVATTEKIKVDFDIHYRIDDECKNLRDWGDAIETKMQLVNFTYAGINQTKSMNKWMDFLDDNLPSVMEGVEDFNDFRMSFGLPNYYGRYKMTFEINSSFFPTHTGTEKQSITFELQY